MNCEDLKPCPICGKKCTNITIEHDVRGFLQGQRLKNYKGIFECGFCESTIKITGDSAKQVFDKWNDLARK